MSFLRFGEIDTRRAVDANSGEFRVAESLTGLAEDYFSYLAKRFPVMCASDEFHFLPRAKAASQHYDRLDDLGIDAIDECVQVLKDFQGRLNTPAVLGQADLEGALDLELLKSNMAGVLIELEKSRSWRHNPLLYLKIAFIGLDHALTKPASSHREIIERSAARLDAIPTLLQQARDNLEVVPETHHQAALLMLADCRRYLAELAEILASPHSSVIAEHPAPSTQHYSLNNRLEKVHSALDGFGKFLRTIKPVPDQDFQGPDVGATLREHFGSRRTVTEVFEIAVEEWHENLSALRKLQGQIDATRSWLELYHACFPTDIAGLDTRGIYQFEVERLRSFFQEHGFPEIAGAPFPEVRETPTYLKSVRSSASFAAGFTADPRERDFFYITTSLPEQRSEEAGDLLRKRLHREYRFLSAHETFPGHHLLDWTRRSLEDPIRAQIESPLFYEGWAYYVESLLTEYDYVDQPLDRLVDRKRRLWRAARCQIDTGLASGLLGHDRALELLTVAGFSREEARNQLDRFRLNPGYQLCYSLGRYELSRLRESYGSRLDRDGFHREILQGGELPFHLIEKRLAALCVTS
jgi:hypothetical protein